ncbi:MAG: hypothetical protein R3E08_09200 [Thiotrichaceae bacterium]
MKKYSAQSGGMLIFEGGTSRTLAVSAMARRNPHDILRLKELQNWRIISSGMKCRKFTVCKG